MARNLARLIKPDTFTRRQHQQNRGHLQNVRKEQQPHTGHTSKACPAQLSKEGSSTGTRDSGQRARPCHVFQVLGSSLPAHLTAAVPAGHTFSKLATTQSARFGHCRNLRNSPQDEESSAPADSSTTGHTFQRLRWQAHAPGALQYEWQAAGKASGATGSPVPRFLKGWEPNPPATFGDGSNDRTTASWRGVRPTVSAVKISRPWLHHREGQKPDGSTLTG